MKAIMILEKNGKKFGYGLSARAGMSREQFVEILHEIADGYEIVLLDII